MDKMWSNASLANEAIAMSKHDIKDVEPVMALRDLYYMNYSDLRGQRRVVLGLDIDESHLWAGSVQSFDVGAEVEDLERWDGQS